MVNKIAFIAKNLTSNVGIFLLLENVKIDEIFDLIESDLVFDNGLTNKINRNLNFVKKTAFPLFVGFFNEPY